MSQIVQWSLASNFALMHLPSAQAHCLWSQRGRSDWAVSSVRWNVPVDVPSRSLLSRTGPSRCSHQRHGAALYSYNICIIYIYIYTWSTSPGRRASMPCFNTVGDLVGRVVTRFMYIYIYTYTYSRTLSSFAIFLPFLQGSHAPQLRRFPRPGPKFASGPGATARYR